MSAEPTGAVHFPHLRKDGRPDYRRRQLCGAPRDETTAAPVQLLYFGQGRFCRECERLLIERIRQSMGW